ncbi:hypothetical protein [Shewanella surugensis]|uniref:Uncharacterized protein n=1 Tax=Shewanella surugensis TaxID=212020 RepID=A0ABT0L997_9GAMM|nr:hypothetical protein [Shewanella surugensis]MCL1124271.1 hypothetical protein [Shewanella surugensis]
MKTLITLLIILLTAWALFHFKSILGIFLFPLFLILVVYITLRLYRMMVKDGPTK